jgi:hypothetical protein
MISKRWRWSARISQGLIILLYFVLPQLSHIGLVFLEFLTVRPVFIENIYPVIGPSDQIHMNEFGLFTGNYVPFFTMEISGTLFSFLIQAGLITLFSGIIARKWKADSVPAISKPMAMATFVVFCTMSLANIWPNLTRADNALPIFQSNGQIAAEAAVTAIPLIMADQRPSRSHAVQTWENPRPAPRVGTFVPVGGCLQRVPVHITRLWCSGGVNGHHLLHSASGRLL